MASRDYDWSEIRYKDKGNEAEVDWACEREYDEYHKITFKIAFHMWDASYQDDGSVKARIQISISGNLDEDYAKIYNEKDRFGKLLKNLHTRVTMREKDEYWDAIWLTMQHDFIAQVQAFLGMRDI